MTGPAAYTEPPAPVFLFDLDGTLIDSVYQHVIAWRAALSRLDIDLSVWRIHRRIGMSGGLFVSALLRETGRTLSDEDIALLQQGAQRGVPGSGGLGPAAARRAGSAGRAHRAGRALGHRDQRVPRDRVPCPADAGPAARTPR